MTDLHVYQGRVAELRAMVGPAMSLGDAVDNLIAFTAAHEPTLEGISNYLHVVAYERLEVSAGYDEEDAGPRQRSFEKFFRRCVGAREAAGHGRLSAMAWVALAPDHAVLEVAGGLRPPKSCRAFAGG